MADEARLGAVFDCLTGHKTLNTEFTDVSPFHLDTHTNMETVWVLLQLLVANRTLGIQC